MIQEIVLCDDHQYNVLIGKSAIDNDVIIKMSHPEDIWFHFQNVSGPHIILQSSGNRIDKKVLYEVASKLFDHKPKVPKNQGVIYTEVKNVKLTKTPGTVITRKIKILKF